MLPDVSGNVFRNRYIMQELFGNNVDTVSEDVALKPEKKAAAAENNPFLSSLENASAEDFAGPAGAAAASVRKRKNSVSNVLSTLFGILCFCVFVYCAFRLSVIFKGYKTSDDLYGFMADEYRRAMRGDDDFSLGKLTRENGLPALKTYAEVLENGADSYDEDEKSEKKTASESFMRTLGLLEKWRAMNSDLYGYIEIPEEPVSRISFPIMQCGDNDYYLYHSTERKYLTAGSIFADFRNTGKVEDNRNLVVYGHNLSNQGMFHFLVNYIYSEEFFNNKDIIVSTFDGIYTFEVFSAYETISTHDYIKVYFRDDEDFIDWCVREERYSKWHKEDVVFDKDSVIVTLSTCINGTANGRIAIHGVLKKVER